MQNSSNPVFSDKLLKKFRTKESTETMTVNGSLAKTAFLLTVLIAVAAWSWSFTEADPARAGLLTIGASISALVVALIIIFTKPNAILSILYAALQGIVVGSISFIFGAEMQGIVLQAISLTVAVTLSMLVLYTTGLVKVTEKLRSVIIIATVGVLFFYLLSFIIGLFSDSFYALVTTGSTGVVISGVIVLVAALNLLLDFDFIDKGAEKELPKQFEWYAAFGLMVTLVWLYISILRMLAASRN
jgi:uncharacterized YccA/Bax inhibitor family protein